MELHLRMIALTEFSIIFVKTAWEEDLLTHKDFEGWQFCQKQDDRESKFLYPSAFENGYLSI